MRLLTRIGVRWAARHPLQGLLTVLGVALGVAVVVAVDLANASARRALHYSMGAISGRATHQIVAGGGQGVPEDLYVRIRRELNYPMAAPVITEEVVIPPFLGRGMRLLGVDSLAEFPFRPFLAPLGGPFSLREPLTVSGAALLEATTAEALGLQIGKRFTIRTLDGHEAELTFVGVLRAENPRSQNALADWIVVDIATAQEVLNRVGRLSRIDLILPEGEAGEALAKRIESVLPVGTYLVPAGVRERSMDRVTRAFRINLLAMSLLALLCGMYLIYNAMVFSVLRRRETFGTLRALGVSRWELLQSVLLEGLWVGVAGALVGGFAGVVLGRGLVRMVARTINDVYFSLEVGSVGWEPLSLLKAALLGVGVSSLAAVVPAWEAARVSPRAVWTRSLLEERVRRRLPWVTALGALLASAGAAILGLSARSLPGSFVGAFAIVIGCSLWVPLGTIGLVRLLRPLARRTLGLFGAMAAQGVAASLSRTGVAIAALMIALSVTASVGMMIASFRQTMVRWLEQALQADIYLAPVTSVSFQAGAVLDPRAVQIARAHPDVEGMNTYRVVELIGEEEATRLVALELDPRGRAAFRFRESIGPEPTLWEGFERGELLLVSEPLAYRRGLRPGDPVVLPTEKGEQTFRVGGVYADYGPGEGEMMIARSTYDQYWNDPYVSSIGLFLRPGADSSRVAQELRRATQNLERPIVVRPTRDLRAFSMEVFDRSFLITGVLRTLTTGVAVIGVIGALLGLQLERAREVGVLRAGGLTPVQLFGLMLTQSGLMGLAAGLFSVPMGTLLAALMVYVINRRSFGWTLEMHLSPAWLLQAVLLGVAAALLAGWYPAWRMSRVPPAEVLREE
ncbi:MAG: permease [Candidatus Poribacteria bacterium]|nr:MAG: permease [Candidatus Poribacteria bacterium]